MLLTTGTKGCSLLSESTGHVYEKNNFIIPVEHIGEHGASGENILSRERHTRGVAAVWNLKENEEFKGTSTGVGVQVFQKTHALKCLPSSLLCHAPDSHKEYFSKDSESGPGSRSGSLLHPNIQGELVHRKLFLFINSLC